MSGSAPQNNQAVQFEQQQAAQAQQQEAQRQAALAQGTSAINAIYDYSPATPASSSAYDWSTFTAPTGYDASGNPTGGSGVPSGYKAVQVTTPATYAGGGAALGPNYNAGPSGDTGGPYYHQAYGSDTGGPYYHQAYGTPGGGPSPYTTSTMTSPAKSTWELQDASGKDYAPGSAITINTPARAGGGFGPDFYNAYNKKILDYYQPDETRQYQEAQRDLTYNLARAGTLDSSYAADAAGKLAYNDAIQKANIVANANQQTGALQSQIASNKQSMINELYSTQDPTLTASMAADSAAASRLQNPNLTPAAALFTPALSAAGSAVSNYLNPANPYGGGTNAPVAQQQANVTPANTSSGKPLMS